MGRWIGKVGGGQIECGGARSPRDGGWVWRVRSVGSGTIAGFGGVAGGIGGRLRGRGLVELCIGVL